MMIIGPLQISEYWHTDSVFGMDYDGEVHDPTYDALASGAKHTLLATELDFGGPLKFHQNVF